ncbi:MAG: FtsX-like permease family protein [Acidimicrobiia bacterium]
MFLALKEMRRAKVRFGLLMVAVALLVFLILFQQSLQNGLLTGFVGGIRNQSAPVLVFSVDGRRNVQGSIITPDAEALIASASGIGDSGRIGQGTFTVLANGVFSDAAIIGYEKEGLGSPTTLIEGRLPQKAGEAVASDVDGPDGFALGDTVTLDPGGYRITVVGVAEDIQLLVTPTLFTTYDTYLAAVKARNPDGGAPLPNLIALRPAAGVSDATLVDNVNALSPDVDALTRSDAANKTPGVAQVRQSFLVIFLLYGLVVPFVTGLFFLIITFQKAGALTLLRAIGAPARKLIGALFVQVLAVVGIGYLLGLALYYPISQMKLGGIHLRFQTGAVVFWAVVLVVFAIASAWFSVKRVLRIEPVQATTGVGVVR